MNRELQTIIVEVEKAVVGKREVIEKILMALLADGHVLLDDIPGVGKTTLAVALSRTLGLTYNRIQFTPDVLPSDIVGFSIYNKDSGCFEYKSGVVSNTNLLLGDEINRTSSKTQSALLEAMEERQVTVDGTTYPLQKPFAVIATQNNVGTAGTQLLPYAQMDRFLVRLSIGYPDYEAQMSILRDRQSTDPIGSVAQVITRDDVLRMQAEVRAVTAKDSILDYITRLAMASREHPMVEVGISPRGTLFLDRMAKAHAYLEGRDYVTGGDVQAIFHDVCAHRVILNQKSRLSGGTVTRVRAVCGVGMGQTGTQTDNTRKKSAISADIPLFTLQGNFDVKKLHGVYRLMMEIMVKTAGKGLAEKKDRTPEEDDMLDMMRCGGERVKEENLGAVLDWYSAQR